MSQLMAENLNATRSRVPRMGRCVCFCLFILIGFTGDLIARQPPAPVVVAKVESVELNATASYVGTIRPSQRAVIGSAVGGRVEACLVEEGDRVKKGQPLVQVLTNTIELELKSAQATLALRKSELTELENGLRPGEIEQANARMQAARATSDLAKTQLVRMQKLRQSNAIPIGELDQAQAMFDQSDQNYLDLKSAFELAREGTRTERIEQARAMVDFQQAEVDRIKDQIKKYTVITRFDGYVVAQHVDDGAWVVSGAPVMEVVALDEVEIVAAVNEHHVRHVQAGTAVQLVVPALPDVIFTGTIRAVVPQADLQARTFPVIIRVKNTINDNGPLLKAGMVARVKLPTAVQQIALMVPKDALVLGGKTPVVYVVAKATNSTDKQNTPGEGLSVNPIPVQPGIAQGNLIQVTGNLEPGQPVVVEGNERLRPGQSVTVVNAEDILP